VSPVKTLDGTAEVFVPDARFYRTERPAWLSLVAGSVSLMEASGTEVCIGGSRLAKDPDTPADN
jgi:hypothetical protein